MKPDKESEEMKILREITFDDSSNLKEMVVQFTDGEIITIDNPIHLASIKKILRKKFEENEAR